MQTTTLPSGNSSIAHAVRAQTALAPLLLVLLAAILLWPYRHFAGDDAYITFRFVHNVVTGGGYSFNTGQPTYGSTAPLWVFMLAGLSSLGVQIPTAAHALNWLFALLDVALFFRLATVYLGKRFAAVAATILFLADPWFIRWSLSGMENALALCLLCGLLLSQARLRNSGRVNWLAPLLGALAALCRPEMSLLGGLLALDLMLFERRRLRANFAALLAAYALVVTPWLAYALHVFHSPIPNTITAKVTSDHLAALLKTLAYFGTFWILQALAVLAVVTARPLRARFLELFARPLDMWFLPASWALLLPLFYIAGGAPVAGRYMVFGLPCYLLLGVAAWSVLWTRIPKAVVSAFVLTLLGLIYVQLHYCWYVTRWQQGMDPRLIDAALTLKQTSRNDDLVAADQIGVLGYFSERPILDIFGLVSPEIMPYRKSADPAAVWRYVHERRAQYVLATDSVESLTRLDPAYDSLTLVKEITVQREGAGAADNPPTVYYLYRTNWPR